MLNYKITFQKKRNTFNNNSIILQTLPPLIMMWVPRGKGSLVLWIKVRLRDTYWYFKIENKIERLSNRE